MSKFYGIWIMAELVDHMVLDKEQIGKQECCKQFHELICFWFIYSISFGNKAFALFLLLFKSFTLVISFLCVCMLSSTS